jgi:hypothetical protein
VLHANGQTDSQADRYDEVNGHFRQFCERALKLKISYYTIRGQGSNNRVFYNSKPFTE